jgi:hypothetical protein
MHLICIIKIDTFFTSWKQAGCACAVATRNDSHDVSLAFDWLDVVNRLRLGLLLLSPARKRRKRLIALPLLSPSVASLPKWVRKYKSGREGKRTRVRH